MLAAGLLAPYAVRADSIDLRRDDVIPVIAQKQLDFSSTREGDRFTTIVDDNRILPWGSRVEGRVERIERKDGKRPAFMDIQFTTIILPDGRRVDFRGTAVPLSKDYVTKDRDGRWQAKKGIRKETAVLGGAAAGLILGSIIKKPFEGALLGAIAGIVVAETDKTHIGDGNVVVAKGAKLGALVDQNVRFTFDGDWDRRGTDRDDRDRDNRDGYDRYGYDRDGRYNARYDTTRGDRDDDGRYDRDDGADSRVPSIQVGSRSLRYTNDLRPYRSNGVVMVPLRSTAEQLNLDLSVDRNSGQARLENEDDRLVLEQDSKTYRLNGKGGTLPLATERRNGVEYVPLEAFGMVVRSRIIVDGTRY